jgi:hypothetical protein
MDASSLGLGDDDREWYCVMNSWDEALASCAAPQEVGGRATRGRVIAVIKRRRRRRKWGGELGFCGVFLELFQGGRHCPNTKKKSLTTFQALS